jgi:hypothetical protein
MRTKTDRPPWLPCGGRQYVRSGAFNELVEGQARALAEQAPQVDFSLAVNEVFLHFSRRLREDASFINLRDFPTEALFARHVAELLWEKSQLARGMELHPPYRTVFWEYLVGEVPAEEVAHRYGWTLEQVYALIEETVEILLLPPPPDE